MASFHLVNGMWSIRGEIRLFNHVKVVINLTHSLSYFFLAWFDLFSVFNTAVLNILLLCNTIRVTTKAHHNNDKSTHSRNANEQLKPFIHAAPLLKASFRFINLSNLHDL